MAHKTPGEVADARFQLSAVVRFATFPGHDPDEQKYYTELKKQDSDHAFVRDSYHHEFSKPYPVRYPMNEDSIGIEIVGRAIRKTPDGKDIPEKLIKDFERLTSEEQRSLDWLIPALLSTNDSNLLDTNYPDGVMKSLGGRPSGWLEDE